jgi:Family of unknown function (DUF6000)
MRYDPEDPGLAASVDRYVRPDGRYLELLHGNFLRLPEPERTTFVRALKDAAQQATVPELSVLLKGEWRARLTGSVLSGLARRTVLRDRIGSLLLASEVCYSGQGYCYALASFGTPEDAALLVAYLDRYLPQTQLRYDQPWALGALLHIDGRLGTRHATSFMTPNGLWQRWADTGYGTPPEPEDYRRLIADLCALAESGPPQ